LTKVAKAFALSSDIGAMPPVTWQPATAHFNAKILAWMLDSVGCMTTGGVCCVETGVGLSQAARQQIKPDNKNAPPARFLKDRVGMFLTPSVEFCRTGKS